METYYQESGRAGRDGLHSECLLFYRPADVPRQSSMVFYENCGLQNLYDIVRYCWSKSQCRRGAFFRHFAEPLQNCNGMCDICASPREVKEYDVSSHASIIVSVLQDTQNNDQRLTMLQLVEKLKTKIKDLDPELKRDEMEQLVIQLILDRVLKEEFQHTAYSTNAYVTLGPLAKQVAQGKKAIKFEICTQQKSRSGQWSARCGKRSLTSSGLPLKLDELRKEIASAHEGLLPHSVLSTQQISMLSVEKPDTLEKLEGMIGKLKTGKYGAKILDEIKKYMDSEHQCQDTSANEQGGEHMAKKQKTRKTLVVIDSDDEDDK